MHGRKGPDGASRYAADAHDLDTYARAQLQLVGLRTPLLVADGDDHSRLYVASFDGTGNDRTNPSMGAKTNVALIYEQIEADAAAHPAIRAGYVPGPGTQKHLPERVNDLGSGATYEARIEEMYLSFCRQAKEWLQEDPAAVINLANVGFSRGAEQAAGLARLVEQRGIRDPSGARIHRNRDHIIDSVEYDDKTPPLRPPGSAAQAELLFDPVGTGEPSKHDRRPPKSVLAGLQIYAEDERRDLFPASRIIDRGLSADGRFLGVVVGGAHSNVGGGYTEDGLSRRSFNLGVDFLNSLSERPFLQKAHLRPDLDVVVRSVEHAPFYDDDHYRANERAGLAPEARRPGFDCIDGRPQRCDPGGRDAEPVDGALDARFERRPVPTGPVPPTPDEFRNRPPAPERDDLQPNAPPAGPFRLLLKPIADVRDPASAALLAQSEAAVRALDAQLGRGSDEASARMAASLASLAKTEGFERIDAVVLSRQTDRVRAGENVFVVQGGLIDPTSRVAHMKTEDAIGAPVEQSLQRIALAEAARVAERTRGGPPGPEAPAMASHRLTV